MGLRTIAERSENIADWFMNIDNMFINIFDRFYETLLIGSSHVMYYHMTQ